MTPKYSHEQYRGNSLPPCGIEQFEVVDRIVFHQTLLQHVLDYAGDNFQIHRQSSRSENAKRTVLDKKNRIGRSNEATLYSGCVKLMDRLACPCLLFEAITSTLGELATFSFHEHLGLFDPATEAQRV